MKRLGVPFVGLMLLTGCGQASEPAPTCEELATEVITEVTTSVPLPPQWTMEWVCEPPVDRKGQAICDDFKIDLWLTGLTREEIEFLLLHELGHAYDCWKLDSNLRDWWMLLRGTPEDTQWNHDDPRLSVEFEVWLTVPTEDFADSFAYCYTGYEESIRFPVPSTEQCGAIQFMTGVKMSYGQVVSS